MTLTTWEYKVCQCKPIVVEHGSLFSKTKGYWVLVDEDHDAEIELTKGLAEYGAKGWELAGIHTMSIRPGGVKELPTSFYVFKRSLGSL